MYICVCVYVFFSLNGIHIDIANLTTFVSRLIENFARYRLKTQHLKTVSYFFTHSRMENNNLRSIIVYNRSNV